MQYEVTILLGITRAESGAPELPRAVLRQEWLSQPFETLDLADEYVEQTIRLLVDPDDNPAVDQASSQ
jgi:hypothetical protein